MVVQCSNDRVPRMVQLPAALGVGLCQHAVNVQHLNARVHAPGGAQLTVRTEGAGPTVTLVAGHVRGFVEGGLGGIALHLGLVLEV